MLLSRHLMVCMTVFLNLDNLVWVIVNVLFESMQDVTYNLVRLNVHKLNFCFLLRVLITESMCGKEVFN